MATKPNLKDSREFVRITTALPDDPKLALIDSPQAGLAGWLYVTAICWSRAQKTDGVVTPRTVERKAGVAARWSRELIRVGLWHAPGHDCPSCDQPPAGQVVIHDYLEHQQSKAESMAATQSGRAAAEARWKAKADAKRNADRKANGNADGNAGGNAEPNADRNAEVEVEEEPKETTSLLVSGSDSSSSSVGKREVSRSDDDDGPSREELIERGTGRLTPSELAVEADAFLAHNAGRWSDLHSIRRAWSGWLTKAVERNRATPTPGTPSCPRHPDQPTGSKACPRCAAVDVPPPGSLRALRDDARSGS